MSHKSDLHFDEQVKILCGLENIIGTEKERKKENRDYYYARIVCGDEKDRDGWVAKNSTNSYVMDPFLSVSFYVGTKNVTTLYFHVDSKVLRIGMGKQWLLTDPYCFKNIVRYLDMVNRWAMLIPRGVSK